MLSFTCKYVGSVSLNIFIFITQYNIPIKIFQEQIIGQERKHNYLYSSSPSIFELYSLW